MKAEEKKQNKKHYNYYYNGISIVLFIISYYFYYLSLEKCLDGIAECSIKWNWIKLKIKQYIISLLINIVLISLIILQKLSKFHLIHFISVFALFLRYSHHLDFHDHGGFNFIFFCIILFLALLILNKYGCQIVFPKKCNYKILQYIQDLSKLSHISCSKKKKKFKK